MVKLVIVVDVAVGGGGGEKWPIGGGGNTAVVLLGSFTVDATPPIRCKICKRVDCTAFDTNVFSIKDGVDIIPDVASGGRSIIGISATLLLDQEIRKVGIFRD